MTMDGEAKIPAHVGIIMDGNGRWAMRRLLPRSYGHEAGMKRMYGLVPHIFGRGIKYLTVYALSTENLSRPKEELDGLFSHMRKFFAGDVRKLYKKNVAVKIIGDLSALPVDIRLLLGDAEKNSPKNAEYTLTFAIAYGGRREIVAAVNAAVRRGETVTEEEFGSLLYTGDIPDPDFIIRTGGETRLSNFLIYQSAYAELYFTDTLFPDFTPRKFDRALEDYAGRERRFGRTD